MSKLTFLRIAGTLFAACYAAIALAHDPKEHVAESAEPDCAAMKSVDGSNIDMEDPIAKAVYQKCQNAMGQDQVDQHGIGDVHQHVDDDSHHADDDAGTHADTH